MCCQLMAYMLRLHLAGIRRSALVCFLKTGQLSRGSAPGKDGHPKGAASHACLHFGSNPNLRALIQRIRLNDRCNRALFVIIQLQLFE